MSPDVLINHFLRVDPRSAAAAVAFGPGGVDPPRRRSASTGDVDPPWRRSASVRCRWMWLRMWLMGMGRRISIASAG